VLKFAWNCAVILEEGKKKILLWNLDVESLVDFLYPQLSKEEESGAASPEINMGVRCSAAEMY